MKTVLSTLIICLISSLTFADGIVQKTKILFHAGERVHLQADIAANTIPQDIWDKFIFSHTNFDLPEYRRGLYGAESLNGIGLYSTYKILEGKDPWVMVIHIKSECLTNEKIFPAYYYVQRNVSLGKPMLFNDWFWQNHESLRESGSLCLGKPNKDGFSAWNEGALYEVHRASAEEQAKGQVCATVLNRFIIEKKLKVIGDNANSDSWYLRDRNCIESITGTADELLRALAKNKIGDESSTLRQNLFGDPVVPGAYAFGNLYLAIKILSETSLLDRNHYLLLNTIIGRLNVSISEVRDARKEPIINDNSQAPALFVLALKASKNAIDKNQVKQFQSRLTTVLADLVVDHGKSCQGDHGVPEQFRDACDKAADRATEKLMKLFSY